MCILAVHTTWLIPIGATLALLGILAWVWPRRGGRHRPAWRGWLSLSIALGCAVSLTVGCLALAHITHRDRTAERLTEQLEPTTPIELTLQAEPKAGDYGYGVHARITATAPGGTRVGGELPVFAMGVDQDWRVGQQVTVTGSLSTGNGHRYYLRVAEIITVREPHGVSAVVDRIRRSIRAASANQAPHARGLIPGVAIGDDRRLPAHMAEAMRVTSLTHITAVSGAHVAIVTGTVLTVLGRAPRWLRAICTGAALGAMVLVALPTPSVVRAAGMGSLTLFAFASRRPRLALPALLGTVIVLLATDPWLATSIGFALSVFATAGIICMTRPVAQLLGHGHLGRTLAVPLAAQLWCAPLLLTFEASLATYAVPANALATWALTPATLLGLASGIAGLVAPGVGAVLASWAGLFTAWIVTVANFFAGLPAAQLPWFSGVGGVGALIVLSVAGGAGVWLMFRHRTWQA